MTAYEIYRAALALLGEEPQLDALHEFTPAWMNLLLAEGFYYENNLRRHYGLEELAAAPQIYEIEAELPYCRQLLQPAFVYGLAGFMAAYLDNEYYARLYRGMYISALQEQLKYEKTQVEDIEGVELW